MKDIFTAPDELYARLNWYKRKSIITLILLIISIIATIVVFIKWRVYSLIGIAAAIAFGVHLSNTKGKFTRCYKKNVVRIVLSNCGFLSDVVFDSEDGIPEETVSNTGMITMGDQFVRNDLISAVYRGINFSQSDINVQKRDSGGSYLNILFGRWITINYDYGSDFTLQVVCKRFTAEKIGDSLSLIDIPYKKFADRFSVYSNDPDKTLQILTNEIMDSFIKLRKELEAPIMLMLVNHQIHIAVENNRDAFEPKLFSKIDRENEESRIISDIKVATNVIDTFLIDAAVRS